MDLLDSSDDDCNIYTNAALKLNALNREPKQKIKEYESNNGDSDGDNRRITRSLTKQSNSLNRKRPKRKNQLKNADMPHKNTETVIILDDNVDDLNNSCDLSFLSQSSEDHSYIMIGSPPVSKRLDTDDYFINVKVLWKSNEVKRFEMKRNETFQKVFNYFSNQEGVADDQILITKKDKRIGIFDTPASIDWSIVDILEGGVITADVAKKSKISSIQNEIPEDVCKIKIQTSDKKILNVILKKDETFEVLLKSCSEQLDIPLSKIKLVFDGEQIEIDETPYSLDLDEEACIDLKIIK